MQKEVVNLLASDGHSPPLTALRDMWGAGQPSTPSADSRAVHHKAEE